MKLPVFGFYLNWPLLINTYLLMNKFYTLICSAALMAAVSTTASAEGIHVGYCNGNMPTEGMGQSGSNATIDAAIWLTPEMLAPYTTCQITSLYVGLANSSEYPETITGWLRADKEGENIVTGSVAAQSGWLTIQFDAPVNIADYAQNGIWAGMEYVQPKKLGILAIGGETQIENSCWVAKNGKWSDYKKYGILSIEAIVEGDDLPQHDLTITRCTIRPEIVKLGTEIKVKGAIQNNALQLAESPVITLSFEDKSQDYTLPVSLKYRESADFELVMPLDPADDVERSIDVNVDLAWADGITDDYEADNHASTSAQLVKEVIYRKMVVEEATGAWCGFCVRGIVGLRHMKANYPDQFIGMAVHDGDDYVVGAYDSWIERSIDGYPSCLVNRDGFVYDPSAEDLEYAMQEMPQFTNVGLSLYAKYDGMLHITTTINCLYDMNVNYRLAYVVLEDHLPIQQHNYYSGGGYGPMDGFEDMPSVCDILVDDVVRAIYPSPEGAEGSVPAQLLKDAPATSTIDVEMCNYADAKNLSVVAFIIDMESGEIVNGEKTEYIEGLNATGIEGITKATESLVYNLRGQRYTAPQAGLNVLDGKVVFIAK